MVRCFIAVEICAEVRDALVPLLRELAACGGVNVVAPCNLHITLKFLGEVDGKKAEATKGALSGIKFPAFDVRFSGIGAFPNERSARVIWVAAQSAELPKLAALVEDALASLGFAREQRGFSAHLTLGRVKTQSAALRQFLQRYAATDFGACRIGALLLKKSTLTPTGPVYETLAEHLLEP